MTWSALGGYAAFVLLAFGVRTVVHYRRTGRTGWVRPRSPVAWLSEGLLTLSGSGSAIGPAFDLAGALGPMGRPPGAVRVLGVVVLGAGMALSLAAQRAMGRSWRAGVDPAQRTELVTSGPFGVVRNPFYVAMLSAGAGVALVVPNGVSVGAVGVLVIGMELLVRLVEEPYLRRTHGEDYVRYASRTGRFVPGLGARGVTRGTRGRRPAP